MGLNKQMSLLRLGPGRKSGEWESARRGPEKVPHPIHATVTSKALRLYYSKEGHSDVKDEQRNQYLMAARPVTVSILEDSSSGTAAGSERPPRITGPRGLVVTPFKVIRIVNLHDTMRRGSRQPGLTYYAA